MAAPFWQPVSGHLSDVMVYPVSSQNATTIGVAPMTVTREADNDTFVNLIEVVSQTPPLTITPTVLDM